jgi:hypothetical protein
VQSFNRFPLGRARDARLRHRKISGALAGASFIVVTQVATRDKIDEALGVATVLFAFALPFLLLFWLRSPVKTSDLSELGDMEGMEFFLLIVLLDLAGFVAFFFHFGTVPGWLFVAGVLIAIWVFLKQVRFSRALLWDLLRRYPSLPKRLFHLASDPRRETDNQT